MIITHPTHKNYDHEPCPVVQCDFCDKLAPPGRDLHSAVERARDAKFSTVPGESVIAPRKWSCPPCTSKRSV